MLLVVSHLQIVWRVRDRGRMAEGELEEVCMDVSEVERIALHGTPVGNVHPVCLLTAHIPGPIPHVRTKP